MHGTGISEGIAIGRAYVLRNHLAAKTGLLLEDESAVQAEVKKYQNAVAVSIDEVKDLIASMESRRSSKDGHDDSREEKAVLDILETQIELLGDQQIERDVFKKINDEKKNAHDALLEVIYETEQVFLQMNDEYLSARAADVKDIGNRILQHLGFTVMPLRTELPGTDTIVIAPDLSPTDTISLDRTRVIGFATEIGGSTSHAAIIARSWGLPAVAGCGDALKSIKDNDTILLDGQAGLVLINPDQHIIDEYSLKRAAHIEKTRLLQSLKDIPATTTDGMEITLLANIATAADVDVALEYGSKGVGLLRTELLFMGRESFPTEEEQYAFYKTIALRCGNKPVTIRTIDIGGDKPLPYFGLPKEQNPFLGYRAIRICLDRKDIFLTQLRAILKASLFGKFKILFPMIGNVQEIRSAKEILVEAKNELKKEGVEFDENIPVGIMIEIPAAAITADLLAKEVDFFSIGTNDLCQYTLAVDRMNEKIKDLYDPFNPGVLRLIHYTIEQAHKNKIGVGMCGELASDPLATLLLAGMGLDEFSMNAASVPVIKNIIIHNSRTKAEAVFKAVSEMDNSQDIKNYLKEVNK
jgi:phosphotransferase system enzyme I (PtsI)